MSEVIELYEDMHSEWVVLTSQEGTTGYRFRISDRLGQSTFPADAAAFANGGVHVGLERVDLSPESDYGMELVAPCALWKNGRVEWTGCRPGALTEAYILGRTVIVVQLDELR